MLDESNFGTRDKKGYWKPFGKILTQPLYIVPFKPLKFIKWIFGWNGYLFPWKFIWICIAVLCWFYLTQTMNQMQHLKFDWIAFIFFRNCIITFVYVGFFHWYWYLRKSQNTNFKYNAKFPETNNSKFLFRDQIKDNLIWTFCSAIPIWTAYEVLTLWAFANEFIFWINWDLYPIYLISLIFLFPFIHDLHFYLGHRLLHWKPLYRMVHKVHHYNINPGPWSGIAMHPIEHIIYFSGIMIYWIIPSHPIIAISHIFYAGLAPNNGHGGFDKIVFKKGKWISTESYYHYLHHKYFECNYAGDTMNFLDKVFGTFHDGTDESYEKLKQKISYKKRKIKPSL